ncbi:RNA polymerase sigma-70 factor [Micromonospora sp. NPDC050495]|uniref:RNA polymerase sigma-70 factor n=1 Tax=Micromonospora sp. NPDC050495 TaxID=3154936 RepID=UPI0033CD72D1
MEDTVREFEKHRPVLLGLAYRLLGSMWDAEDVVQDAYLRWTGVDRSQIRDSRAFLVTVVSRLALDQLRSARVTRESYRGPWLPEPVFTGALGPLDTAELRDTISYATMHLMERLAPPERAVFVLREAFGLPYEDIAQAVGTSTANCRQMYHRARRHLAGERDRFHPSPKEHLRLLTAFLHAAQNGDLAELTRILAEDVTAWNDGGGTVRAALHPIVGRPKVLAFVAGLRSRYGIGPARLVEVNGEAAAWAEVDGQQQLITVDVRSGRICAIFAVLNPAKLAHVSPESTP